MVVKFFNRGDLHGCEAAGGGIVGEGRLADAVEGIASVAAEGVVEALDRVGARDTDDGFVGEGAEVIVSERRDACRVNSTDLLASAVVDERDRRGIIGIDRVRERSVRIVGVRRDDAAGPGARREFAVGGIVVSRTLSVGVDLVRHAARRFVVKPARRVALSERFVTIGRHRDLVAVFVVDIIHGIRRAALREDAPFRIVCRRDGVRQRVCYARLPTKRVVAVGRGITECVNGRTDAVLRIVDRARRVAAAIGDGRLAFEGVISACRRDASLRSRGADESVRRDRDRGCRRSRIPGPGDLLRRGAVAEDTVRRRVTAEVNADLFGREGPALRRLAESGDARPRRRDELRLRAAVPMDRPATGLAPPHVVERNVPRVVRNDAVRVAPVDLAVQVHVGDGQDSLTKGIIAYIGVGERNELEFRVGVGGITARCDELVRGVVLVGGDEESATEAGTGFADGAAERVFIRTTPARRGKTCGAFVGLGPVRAVFVGRLHDAVQHRFLGAPVGVGDGRCLRFRAVAAAGLLSLLSYRHAQRHIHCDIFTGVSPSRTPHSPKKTQASNY